MKELVRRMEDMESTNSELNKALSAINRENNQLAREKKVLLLLRSFSLCYIIADLGVG